MLKLPTLDLKAEFTDCICTRIIQNHYQLLCFSIQNCRIALTDVTAGANFVNYVLKSGAT
jgi:hypothetical protein